MELCNTSTPETAFKTSVCPIACLCILQSFGLFFVSTTWPVEELVKFPFPFMPDPMKKGFLIASAVFLFVIGVGLFLRSKPIWYVFLTYLVLAPIWLILGIAFDYFPGTEPKEITIPLALVFSALIGVGLFVVTRPAFK